MEGNTLSDSSEHTGLGRSSSQLEMQGNLELRTSSQQIVVAAQPTLADLTWSRNAKIDDETIIEVYRQHFFLSLAVQNPHVLLLRRVLSFQKKHPSGLAPNQPPLLPFLHLRTLIYCFEADRAPVVPLTRILISALLKGLDLLNEATDTYSLPCKVLWEWAVRRGAFDIANEIRLQLLSTDSMFTDQGRLTESHFQQPKYCDYEIGRLKGVECVIQAHACLLGPPPNPDSLQEMLNALRDHASWRKWVRLWEDVTVPLDPAVLDGARRRAYSLEGAKRAAFLVDVSDSSVTTSNIKCAGKIKDILKKLGFETQTFTSKQDNYVEAALEWLAPADETDFSQEFRMSFLYFAGHGSHTHIYSRYSKSADGAPRLKSELILRLRRSGRYLHRPRVFFFDCCAGVNPAGAAGTPDAASEDIVAAADELVIQAAMTNSSAGTTTFANQFALFLEEEAQANWAEFLLSAPKHANNWTRAPSILDACIEKQQLPQITSRLRMPLITVSPIATALRNLELVMENYRKRTQAGADEEGPEEPARKVARSRDSLDG